MASGPENDTAPTQQPNPRKGGRLQDARSLRSQSRLKDGLLRLIEEQPLEQISLREIAAEAGVSYPTLFNHYASKEDLFRDAAHAEIAGLLEAFREGRHGAAWRPGLSMCTYVMQRPGLWRTLLTTGASSAMRAEFIRRGRVLAEARELAHRVPIDVVSGVIASGTFEIIAWWLGQPAGTDTDRVAAMLETLVIEPALGLSRGYFAAGVS